MSVVGECPVVFTAQSKLDFFCRDAVCEFVFRQGAVPLNPFRAFEYFLGDRVERDLVRRGNNNLIRIADELWVFGDKIADGVLFEIYYAQRLGKPVRFFSIHNDARKIGEVDPRKLTFEREVYTKTKERKDDLIARIAGRQLDQLQLFDRHADQR
jgi:hypothetical protein